ncbi:MAG: hypothetical protein HKN46_05255, partial [Acidimicrobiia bacterium]|nr:hypothetical protein [Acidimicrobiia bacterium]
PFERAVRAEVFRHFAGGAHEVDAGVVARSGGWDIDEAAAALTSLHDQHRLVLHPGTTRVWMAHPFSGVDTGYTATIGNRTWWANCAWDSLAILALLGEGIARGHGPRGRIRWTVADGTVEPEGWIHLVVPARRFYDDIGFT